MNKETLLAHRLARQGMIDKAQNEQAYRALLHLLQPVAPVHFTMPGLPPQLVHRTTFDDAELADRLRGRAELVKGRFWGGNIGYVLAGDLELYATAFRKPIARLNPLQERVLEVLWSTGPLTPRQLAEESGRKNKEIMPVLHRLQQAFQVYEAQEDSSWERSWSLFNSEWPDLDLERQSWQEAATEVVLRFVRGHVFATKAQLRDWSQWGVRPLAGLLQEMEAQGQIAACTIDGLGEGWTLPEDGQLPAAELPRQTFMMHRADLLVKSHLSELKERFAGREVLQYLLIDGEFSGAVCGHWRIGPHDVDDIAVLLADPAARRAEIVAEVERGYYPPHSRVVRYDDREL